MGIFGALTTAVTGMRAQSFSLENISGNIANSQTTAFKRTDTSFQDLVLDSIPSKQIAGNVLATSRSTNNVQGDIQSNSISTFMAINGDGFFVVQKPSGFIDGSPTFDAVELYTRRGDFQPDKNGYLVNAAGYYLMGVPVDPTTGNLVGSVPQTLKFQNDFLPAQATTAIEYRLNLPRVPTSINAYSESIPNSELLNPGTFTANPVAGPNQPARIVGFGANLLDDAPAQVVGEEVLPPALVNATSGAATLILNGTSVTLTAGMTPAQVLTAINTSNAGGLPVGLQAATLDSGGHLVLESTNADTQIVIAGTGTAVLDELGITTGTVEPTNLLTQSAVGLGDQLVIDIGGSVTTFTFGTGADISTLQELNAELSANITGGSGSVDSDGNVTIQAQDPNDNIELTTPSSVASAFGLHVLIGLPSDGTVVGQDVTAFINQSLGAGAVTAYDSAGSPVNIQLRWAKVASVASGGADTWNLFYQVDSTATGDEDAWKNVGINYTFGANFQLDPPIATVSLNNVVVDGISLGNITVSHGANGVTQFSDTSGAAQVNFLQQNGYAAGELQTVSVSDKGRVVGSYSNGRTIDLAEITLAEFNGPNMLKRLDGGAFAVTDESGPAIYGASGKIAGSALEGSNTDIADEFSKLIVTQQAYSANTRIITTGNQMVQDLLNMVR